MVTLGGPRLNPQLAQQVFEVGLVDDDFAGRLPVGAGLDDAIIKGLEETHRSEEHTSELQSRLHLVCRLLLEKKKTQPSESPSTGLHVHTIEGLHNSHKCTPLPARCTTI